MRSRRRSSTPSQPGSGSSWRSSGSSGPGWYARRPARSSGWVICTIRRCWWRWAARCSSGCCARADTGERSWRARSRPAVRRARPAPCPTTAPPRRPPPPPPPSHGPTPAPRPPGRPLPPGALAGAAGPVGGATLHPVVAPALTPVGSFMLRAVTRLELDAPPVAVASFLTVVTMPFTFSISEGIAFGFISYAALMLAAGRGREVHPLLYVFAALFLVRYALLG